MMKIKVIMAGSGALYPLYVGALHALEEAGVEIVSIAGTSGGAIAASLWSLGKVERDRKSLESVIGKTLPKNNKGMISYSLANFIKNWGLVRGESLEKQLDSILLNSLGEARIPTYIYAAKVNRNEDVVFSSILNPDLPVAKVVRASCSIPFIFDPTSIEGELYVDGGWSTHIPLDTFEEEESEDNIVGMRIVKSSESATSSNLIDYMQNMMYKNIISNYKKESLPENITMFDFHSKFNRMNLAKTTNESALAIFEEGYSQTKEKLQCLLNGIETKTKRKG